MTLNLIPNMPCFMAILKFDLGMTLKWHLLTSNDLQFYLECYKCVLRLRNRYETCATLIFSKVLKSQKLKKRAFGGHLGNDVIEKKAPMKRFYFCSKYSLHSLRSQNQSIVEPE